MTLLARSRTNNPIAKLALVNWKLIALVVILCVVGITVLYSAGRTPCASPPCPFGGWQPWAVPQLSRMILGFAILFFTAMMTLKFWVSSAYWIYGLSIALLVGVMLFGRVGMGAQRWLNIGFMQFQPSELMKIALVLALSKYFSGLSINEIRSNRMLLIPTAMVGLPVLLVAAQPDLGTAIQLMLIAGTIFFIAGVQKWKFGAVIAVCLIAAPLAYKYALHDYQRARVNVFLDPESDVMGAGYHITQSKITIGSGGVWGKGFLEGTQSQLAFLPEKHTDFIFTMFAEQFGLVGCLLLFALIISIIWQCNAIAFKSRNNFGRILAIGIGANFFIYFFINTAMVMGLIPVVGVPSPLMSYGGTAVLTVLFGFGLAQSAQVHGDTILSSRSSYL
ncbi:MAG: rod shape-determining protein RodA [Alphaproteobacteria bacterium]|nr:rod shape-determining protein RodA [Alphaproteobacteria bacterium]